VVTPRLRRQRGVRSYAFETVSEFCLECTVTSREQKQFAIKRLRLERLRDSGVYIIVPCSCNAISQSFNKRL